MRQTPLKKGKGLSRKQPKRDWTEARAKVEHEEVCRLGRDDYCEGKLEAAHVIGRSCDAFTPLSYDEDGNLRIIATSRLEVAPDRVIPLCTRHHRLYDAHEVDCLHVLTLAEQLQAVADSGGLELARKRLAPSQYREAS